MADAPAGVVDLVGERRDDRRPHAERGDEVAVHDVDVDRARPRLEHVADLGAEALRPGGTLVYSTCTISPAENEAVVQAFLAERGDFRADEVPSDAALWEHGRVQGFLQTLPHRDGTEGFFIARLRREEAS